MSDTDLRIALGFSGSDSTVEKTLRFGNAEYYNSITSFYQSTTGFFQLTENNSCHIIPPDSLNPATVQSTLDCGLSVWPNINVIPYGGIAAGTDDSSTNVMQNRARLLFDGSIITMQDLDIVVSPISLTQVLQVQGFTVMGSEVGGISVQRTPDRASEWRIEYVDSTNVYASGAYANNCFKLISKEDGAIAYKSVNYRGYGADAMVLNGTTGSTKEAENYWFFNFANGGISGFGNRDNPEGVMRVGIFGLLARQSQIDKLRSAYFNVVTPGAFLSTYDSMDRGECCNKGFGASTNEYKVCQAMGLTDGSSATGRCNTFLTNPTDGWCKTSPESAACVAFCQAPGTNCDNIYRAYCASLGNNKATTTSVCGCFMPDTFYGTYNQALKDAGLTGMLDGLGAQPPCNYGKCASLNAILPFGFKGITCPDMHVTACTTINKIDNYGNIGDITIENSQKCGINTKPSGDAGNIGATIVTFLENNWMYIGIVLAIVTFFIVVSVVIKKPIHKRKHTTKHVDADHSTATHSTAAHSTAAHSTAAHSTADKQSSLTQKKIHYRT